MRKLIVLALMLSSLLSVATRAQTVAKPSITPANGSYVGSVVVTITDATPGAVIYYTSNGSTPTTLSKKYTGPFVVHSSATIKAIATLSQSATAIASYTVVVGPPPCLPPNTIVNGVCTPPPATYPFALTLSAASLNFNWVVGTAPPTAQVEQVGDTSPCPPVPPVPLCHWPVNVTVDKPWISATPTTGSTSFQVTVSLNTASLPTVPGTYMGNVILTAPQLNGGIVKVPITVVVTAAPPPPPVCVPPQVLVNGVCTTPSTHTVTLRWVAPVSSPVTVVGYNIYRGTGPGAEFTKVNSAVVTPLTFDDAPSSGAYFYIARSVAADGTESIPSNEVSVVVP